MKVHVALCFAISALLLCNCKAQLTAGVAKCDVSLPVGVPLAGYNHGQRRVPHWPIPEKREYTTFMMPSLGYLQPTWAKALVLDDGAGTRVAFLTLDGIGSDETLNLLVVEHLQALGSSLTLANITFSSSHSHSGPGAISPRLLWALAPATDLLVPELQAQLSEGMAACLYQAEKAMAPAQMDIGVAELIGVTQNRRAGEDKYLSKGTIDPHLGVIAVNDASGAVLATVWNFAIHGVCYGPENMYLSGDIMGCACTLIEQQIGGVALFINGDAGDIDPANGMCGPSNATANCFVGSPLMANAVIAERASLAPTSQVKITSFSQLVPFGRTNLNATLGRFDNCTSGGDLDICSLCEAINCDANVHLDENWLDENPIFNAYRFDINGVVSIAVSIPGEALTALGWWVRNDTLDLGYDNTLLMGYSNAHLGYFATPVSYDDGGYESQLTFFGINTAEMVREGCYSVTSPIAPNTAAPAKPRPHPIPL